MRPRQNRRTRFGLAAVLFAVTVLFLPADALAQSAGVISGTVVNGTTGSPISNATVTLSKFTSRSPESVDISTETDDEGLYTFDGVDTSDGIVYATSLEYADVLYGSGMILVSQAPSATADIVVFEATTDTSAIVIRDRVVLLNGSNQVDGEVSVTDIFNIENTGNRSLVRDENGRTLQLDVPDNASTVSPRPGFDFGTPSVEGSTVYLTSPVRPGTSTPSLTYDIPYRGNAVDLDLSAAYPTSSLRFLVPVGESDEGPSVESNGRKLRDDGITSIGDREYRIWSTSDVDASSVIRVAFVDLPQSAVGNRELWSIEPLIIAAATVVIASTLTTIVVRRRGLHLPRPVTLTPAVNYSLESRRTILADELRNLEAQRHEAHIEEDAYRAQRRTILEELRGISRSMRGLGIDE